MKPKNLCDSFRLCLFFMYAGYCLIKSGLDVLLETIISKTDFNVLQFYKNKNRKPCFSKTCGCFEMVEATGVEPVS